MRLFKNIGTFKNWTVHYRNRFRFASDKGKRGVLEFRNGLSLSFRYHTSDLATSRSIFVDDSYFPAGISIAPDATIVDIGGHIGTLTTLAASRAPKGRVFTFEPEPQNFALLEENVRRNGFQHVRCFNQAVAGKEEEREFYLAPNPVRTGSHSLTRVSTAGSFKVRCTTLSTILRDNRIDRVDLLKLDCEGAEWEIIPATSDEELGKIRQIVMEVHAGESGAREKSFDRLKKVGFVALPHPKDNYAAFVRR
jgi:FkbM family methyltransferase